MCGIAGVVHRDGSPIADWPALAETIGEALAHRGPDGSGAWRSASWDALLVHRRLAIIDPGPDGAQPMSIDDGRHVIVFNGEIYNYRELRGELEGRGHRFRTASDTEVLLRLVIVDGPQALARVRGMFAFAVWNAEARALLVARDRFGIKPLYVAARSGSIAFASELGALRAAKLVDGQPSAAAVLAFLSWGSVPPPLAWNRGAQALPAGTWWEWSQGGVERRGVFADARDIYPTSGLPRRREDDWCTAVGQAVRDSVRAHLVADVPVGVFLSGGIDSGAIVSAAISAGAADLRTFTVDTEEASASASTSASASASASTSASTLSEARRARLVADRFSTRHHELRINVSQVVSDLPAVISRLDQPTIDAVNSFYVSRAVAETGIKAVLSGAGGDELFGGYPSFARLPRAMAVKRMSGPAWPAVAWTGRRLLPARLQPRWRHFAASNGNLAEAYRVQRGFLMPEEICGLAGPALADSQVWNEASAELRRTERLLLDPIGEERPAAAVARLETRLYLQSQLLRDLDVMAMAHGLEVRVPFVDHLLMGDVWPELGGHLTLLARKGLLSKTLERPLPDVVTRHPKQGFTLPFARWMHGALAPVVRDGMDRLSQSGWIGPGIPDATWRAWQRGELHWSRPWALGVLGAFLRG